MSAYIGRFAPSPTGALHFGSLVTALASFLDARHHHGQWLLRIDDIDPLRETPTAAHDIQAVLERCGLEWDGPVLFQSPRRHNYQTAIAQLQLLGLVFYCTCSRKDIEQRLADTDSKAYPGTCRHRLEPPKDSPYSIRLRVPDGQALISFEDRCQGWVEADLNELGGDVVIWRKDDWPSYHLACVIDDAEQQISQIVRGQDLLASTYYHRYLQQCLSLASPAYGHLPVVVNAQGQKLSKQNKARPLSLEQPGGLLWQGLRLLGQAPPKDLQQATPATLLQWAIEHWQWQQIPTDPVHEPEG